MNKQGLQELTCPSRLGNIPSVNTLPAKRMGAIAYLEDCTSRRQAGGGREGPSSALEANGPNGSSRVTFQSATWTVALLSFPFLGTQGR